MDISHMTAVQTDYEICSGSQAGMSVGGEEVVLTQWRALTGRELLRKLKTAWRSNVVDRSRKDATVQL